MIAALLALAFMAQDSAAVHRAAVSAQAAFERTRRAQLPLSAWLRAGGSRCEERIGRFCYWYGAEDPPPPPEPPATRRAREELLDTLAAMSRQLPGDGWITGQRVRYLLEAGRHDEALAVADACQAGPAACHGLRGLAQHVAGDAPAADAAFTAMLAALPQDERCGWADLSLLLEPPEGRRFRRLSCAEQVAEAERLLALSDPLLARDGNAFRGEFYARQVMVTLFEGTVTPHGMRWAADQREMMLRYGWPVGWSRTWSSDILREGSVVGHDPSPAWVFLPVDSREPRWLLEVERARSRARPPAITHLQALESVQLARFPRQGQVLLAARFTVPEDTVLNVPDLGAVLAGGGGTAGVQRLEVASPPVDGHLILTLTDWPKIGGLEFSARGDSAWARYREAWPEERTSPTVVSDLLLFDPSRDVAQDLETALAQALPGSRVRRGSSVGVYWEAEGIAVRDTAEVRLAVRRAGARQPHLRWAWLEPPPEHSRLQRGIALDLARLGRGEYLIELDLAIGGDTLRRTRRLVVQ